MTATPITPGRAYRVTFRGQCFTVLASHPCDAILIILNQLLEEA